MMQDMSLNFHGSLKKRVAPAPPGGSCTHYGTLPSAASHSRTISEPILADHSTHTLPHNLKNINGQHHKRSPSSDSSTGHGKFHFNPKSNLSRYHSFRRHDIKSVINGRWQIALLLLPLSVFLVFSFINLLTDETCVLELSIHFVEFIGTRRNAIFCKK